MNRALLVLGLTTAAFASASGWLWSELRTQREQVGALRSELEFRLRSSARERSELAPAATPSASAQDSAPASLKSALSAVASTKSKAPAASPPARLPPREAEDRYMRMQQILLKDPEYLAALRTQQRMTLTQQYPYLAEDLGLTPETEGRLLDLLTDQQLEQLRDANALPAGLPDTAAIEALQRKHAERARTTEVAIAEILGERGAERWRDYQNTMSARFRARQLVQALDAAGMPLREDQSYQLRQALAQQEREVRHEAESSQRMSQPGPMNAQTQLELAEAQLERTERDYERARDAVAGILSSAQLEQYKSLQEQDLAMRRAQLRIQHALLQAKGDDPALSNGMFVPLGVGAALSDD